eukprot:191360_1
MISMKRYITYGIAIVVIIYLAYIMILLGPDAYTAQISGRYTYLNTNIAGRHRNIVSDSCNEWHDSYRRRTLWLNGKLAANVMCDELYAKDRLEEDKVLHRSCYFRDNSICYDIRNNEWIFHPKSNIYDNLQLLNMNHNISASHKLFDTNYTINLNFASPSIKSLENIINWKVKTIQRDHVPLKSDSSSIYYESRPSILGTHTRHAENPGHVILDSYLAILTTFDNWYQCGINRDTKMNVLLQNNRKSPFDAAIGGAIFDYIGGAVFDDNIRSQYQYLCYKHMIVGTANQQRMMQGSHLKQRMLKYFRNKVLSHYNINPLWKPQSKSDIHMVVLIKNSSFWKHPHVNWVDNLATDVIDWIHDEYVETQKINTLIKFNPADGSLSVEEQIRILSNASIILCQWGGISMTNMFAVMNSVEIIVTMWDYRQGYTKEDGYNDTIPDYDMPTRDTISTQTTLRYWDQTNASRIENLDKNRLFRLIDSALDIVYANYNILY